ncbi:MAG: hydroxyacylglutathione hydrolase [Burkholderiales bacterium]|nr:hydroxyacylglutathione hydrolase [Burkholderiales bacterium]
MLAIHAVPAFKDNYIWILESGGRAAAVDPGDAGPVEEFLLQRGLELSAILATHHHADHVGGLPALAAHWGCPTFGPAREVSEKLDRRLAEGDRFEVPGIGVALEAIDIPGHTAGHIAFAGAGMLFCGDTLFACGCGRLFEGTPAQMVASLGKLARLAPETRVYCGHEYTLANIRFAQALEPGNRALDERKEREAAKRLRGEPTLPSTVGEELETNPFLRCGEPAVIAAAEKHAGRKLSGPVEVFTEIRAWKDAF